jgi:hypothetical protein
MSSMKTTTNLSNSGMNTEFIRYMKCARALVSPNDITKYSYNLYLVENAVLGTSFWTDLDLMITQTEIDLGKDFSTSKLIKKNVDAGQRIFVLDGDGIQRPIINT